METIEILNFFDVNPILSGVNFTPPPLKKKLNIKKLAQAEGLCQFLCEQNLVQHILKQFWAMQVPQKIFQRGSEKLGMADFGQIWVLIFRKSAITSSSKPIRMTQNFSILQIFTSFHEKTLTLKEFSSRNSEILGSLKFGVIWSNFGSLDDVLGYI